MGELAETVAFFVLDGSLLLLAGISLIFIVRAQLGGAIGHSLWLALLGLLLFSLAHPVQVWFYATTNCPSDLLGAVHRLTVMPAFSSSPSASPASFAVLLAALLPEGS